MDLFHFFPFEFHGVDFNLIGIPILLKLFFTVLQINNRPSPISLILTLMLSMPASHLFYLLKILILLIFINPPRDINIKEHVTFKYGGETLTTEFESPDLRGLSY